MSPLARYALFQLPGLLGAALLLFVLWEWAGLPGWAAGLALALLVVKDAALYPLLRRAYELPRDGAEALIGRRGTVRRRLAPRGTVAIGSVLWLAEAADGAVLEVGAAVVVVAAHRLTLVVAADVDHAEGGR